MNLFSQGPNYDADMQDNLDVLYPEYDSNTRAYDFVYNGKTFVRVCSTQPNFIVNFHFLKAKMPETKYEGFEITINRATNAEVRGPLLDYEIGQLADPILISV